MDLDLVLRALAEPHRREILRLVHSSELPVAGIADRIRDVSRAAISQHLRVLSDAGLLVQRRDGRQRYYRARRKHITELRRYVDLFWVDRLDALKFSAEREERRPR